MEQVIVGIIVVVAALYSVRTFLSKFKSENNDGCPGGCSCGSDKNNCSEFKTQKQND